MRVPSFLLPRGAVRVEIHRDLWPFLRLLPIALALLSLAGCRGDLGNLFDIY